MDEIASRLEKARRLAGYETASDAAEAFGWTYSTYAGHENGSRGVKLPTLRGYAAAFKVSFDWLANGKGDPKPQGEKKIIDAYRKLEPADREMLESIAEQFLARTRR